MTISSSLNAGVAGLTANATRLATISDNIANSATYGYKRADSSFHSMVLDSGAGTYSAGGVRVTTFREIDQPGALLSTSNATDLAVRGRGFIPVTNASALESKTTSTIPMSLTTTGSFKTDSEGYLVSDTGLVLLGWPADADGSVPLFPRDTVDGLEPIQINVNQFAGEPTKKVTLGVNLPATSTVFGYDTSIPNPQTSIEYFDNLGTSRQLTVEYTPVPSMTSTTLRSNTWAMTIYDNAQPVSGDPRGTVVGHYGLVFSDNASDGGTLSQVVSYDPTGSLWTGPISTFPSTDTATGALVYDATTGKFTIPVDNNTIDITIGRLGDSVGTGISQLADTFAPTSILKDGSAVGNMVGVDVDSNGYVYANFDIGITRRIYQIPLVDLPNPNGLTPLDNQTFAVSNKSGAFFLWDAGDGPTGDIISYSLEESTTDVAGELTDLIQTQRAYSSNAKVIQTVDEMLQETTNIKR